jgi:hypothetical protein
LEAGKFVYDNGPAAGGQWRRDSGPIVADLPRSSAATTLGKLSQKALLPTIE